jgi:hypothetical protein
VLVEAHIVIAVRRTFAQQSGWKVIPKHALPDAEEPCILDWTDGLAAIAWDQMDRDDRDYENDRDCRLTYVRDLATEHQSILRRQSPVMTAKQ